MRPIAWLAAGWATLALMGCDSNSEPSGNGDGNGDGNAPSASVSVENNQFVPPTANITVGQTVRWTWNSGGVQHNVTFQDGPTSATQGSGTFDRAFTAAGTFPYLCTIHGPSMSGTVVVATTTGNAGSGDGGMTPPTGY